MMENKKEIDKEKEEVKTSEIAPEKNEEDLKQQMVNLQAEAKTYYDQLLRLRADFDNYRKRMERDKALMWRKGKEDVIFNILGVLDNVERAEKSLERKDADIKDLRKGVKLVFKELTKILHKEGLRRMESVGREFDPKLHHAFEHRDTDKVEDHHIIEEIQPGYFFKDEVLRPALVVVADNVGKKEEEKNSGGEK